MNRNDVCGCIVFLACSLATLSAGPTEQSVLNEVLAKWASRDGWQVSQGWQVFYAKFPEGSRREMLFAMWRMTEATHADQNVRAVILGGLCDIDKGDITGDYKLNYYAYSSLFDQTANVRWEILEKVASSNYYVKLAYLNDPADYIRARAIYSLYKTPECRQVLEDYLLGNEGNLEAKESIEAAKFVLKQIVMSKPSSRKLGVRQVSEIDRLPAEQRTTAWVEVWVNASANEKGVETRRSLLEYLSSNGAKSLEWDCNIKYCLCTALREQDPQLEDALIKVLTSKDDPSLHLITMSFLSSSSDAVRGKALKEIIGWKGGEEILRAYVERNENKRSFASSVAFAREALKGGASQR